MNAALPDAEAVLRFWFGAAPEDALATAEAQSALWWGGKRETDFVITARFAALHRAAASGGIEAWLDQPRGRLAAIIVLDQFSRCLYRRRAAAFAQDATARGWCLDGLARGDDRALEPLQRVFFYLPLEHSESAGDQARCVQLMEDLAAEVPQPLRELFGNYAGYARAHRDIIERFGRFPHRNEALHRSSTEAEKAFLTQPGSSF